MRQRGYRGLDPGRGYRAVTPRYEPYPRYQQHYAPLNEVPYSEHVPPPSSVKKDPRAQLSDALKMYCDPALIDRALTQPSSGASASPHSSVPPHSSAPINNSVIASNAPINSTGPVSAPPTSAESLVRAGGALTPVTPTPAVSQPTRMTPVNRASVPVKVSNPAPNGHVPVLPKKAMPRVASNPATAAVVHMTAQQKDIQQRLAPVQAVLYQGEGVRALKFPYDPIEWPKTPKMYILEWFQRQASLRVNKQLALIDPQRAAAMSQVPKWDKLPSPPQRQGLHLVALHVTDPRTLQPLVFTPDRYYSTVKEAEHVASLLFLQYLLPQAHSAKEIHEAMENQQRNQKRLNSTGPGPRKPGAVPADKVGKEIYSRVPPTPQLTVSTRAPDAAPVKQSLDTRPHQSANSLNAHSFVNPTSIGPNVTPVSSMTPVNGPQAYYADYQGQQTANMAYYYQYYGGYPGYQYQYPYQ